MRLFSIIFLACAVGLFCLANITAASALTSLSATQTKNTHPDREEIVKQARNQGHRAPGGLTVSREKARPEKTGSMSPQIRRAKSERALLLLAILKRSKSSI